MDRRTGLGLLLFVMLFYTWALLRREPEPPPGEEVPTAEDGSDPPVASAEPAPAPMPTPDPMPSVAEAAEVAFAGCGAEGTYSTRDGLRDVYLPDHEGPLQVQPLYSWLYSAASGEMTEWKPWGDPPGPEHLLSEYASTLTVGAGPWSQGPATLAVVDAREGQLVLQGRAGDMQIRHTITVDDAETGCVFNVETSWTNGGSSPVTVPLWVGTHERMQEAAGGMMARYDSRVQPLLHVDGDLAYGSEEGGMVGGCVGFGGEEPASPGEPVAIDGPVDWFGIADRYFGFLVLTETEGGVGHFSTRTLAGTDVPLAGAHVSFSPTLAAGETHHASFRVYAGPLDANALEAIDPTLGDAIDLGFFAFFGYPLLWLLRFYQSFVINWGVAIILLTLTVKAAFFKMTQNSYRSMQRMQQIQPEMTRIREEFADEPQEMNRLTMELMAREKVNPLAGCLPMVAQMPVWFALYQVLLSSVDLYHTNFLYLRDLSAPDPYCVLPLIVVALMMIQQQFTNTANMDPAQARVMRFMPLMFGLFFFTFPSGLALYMFVNMTLSILQQWWIKRSLGDAPAAAAA